MANQRLFYDAPARAWVEALPLGNGRIGAMAFGGVERERFALNEDTLWSGYPRETNVSDAARHYPAAQQMTREGRQAEAAAYIEAHMLGAYTQSYLPLGDLNLTFSGLSGEAENYERSLSLSDARWAARFTIGGVTYAREAFVSYPDNALVVRLSASAPGRPATGW
jgi:alpha-L-fucosidase 2